MSLSTRYVDAAHSHNRSLDTRLLSLVYNKYLITIIAYEKT